MPYPSFSESNISYSSFFIWAMISQTCVISGVGNFVLLNHYSNKICRQLAKVFIIYVGKEEIDTVRELTFMTLLLKAIFFWTCYSTNTYLILTFLN